MMSCAAPLCLIQPLILRQSPSFSLGYSDTEVPFRQESNFLYLTGWNMSGAMALFSLDDGSLHLLLQVRQPLLPFKRCISKACRSGPTLTRCGTGPESPLNPLLRACDAT